MPIPTTSFSPLLVLKIAKQHYNIVSLIHLLPNQYCQVSLVPNLNPSGTDLREFRFTQAVELVVLTL